MFSPELLTSTRYQLRGILEEIEEILGGEFPYKHSQDALSELKKRFLDCKDQLDLVQASSDDTLIETTCFTVVEEIRWSIGLVGFLLRSTNVRNAFEAWGPLLRLARKLLGVDTKLVVSSEWEFSPFTFIGLSAIPDFVLIGFPAPESSNPFLLAIAGHELGHNLWAKRHLQQKFQPIVRDIIIKAIKQNWSEFCKYTNLRVNQAELETDIFTLREWTPSLHWALRQCQELFCDCVGTRIFGGSYVCAFEYLLGPQDRAARSFIYPSNFDRAQTIITATKSYGMQEISGTFVKSFKPPPPTKLPARETLLLKIADDARSTLADDLIREAEVLVTQAAVPKPAEELTKKCLKRFRCLSPVEGMFAISELLNAAWISVKTENFYSDHQHEERKLHLISELVWKSIEVFEIEQRLNTP
jgi:hypothetical protein